MLRLLLTFAVCLAVVGLCVFQFGNAEDRRRLSVGKTVAITKAKTATQTAKAAIHEVTR